MSLLQAIVGIAVSFLSLSVMIMLAGFILDQFIKED